MRHEREYRHRARLALEALEVGAQRYRLDWKNRTPQIVDIEVAIQRLSYCVGRLKDYRSIRIQMMKEDEKCQSR